MILDIFAGLNGKTRFLKGLSAPFDIYRLIIRQLHKVVKSKLAKILPKMSKKKARFLKTKTRLTQKNGWGKFPMIFPEHMDLRHIVTTLRTVLKVVIHQIRLGSWKLTENVMD
jgi:hypothetical protein